MRFRFSTKSLVFTLLTVGCGINVYNLITTGQMTIGRQRVVMTTADIPNLLPIMSVLFIVFLLGVVWSVATDS
jgi:hypothetical protein